MIGLLWAALLGSGAQAGSGPWTLPRGAQNLYVGVGLSRFSEVVSPEGTVDLGDVRGTTLKAIGTVGLLDGVEVELSVPWTRNVHLAPDAGACASGMWSRDFCSPSAGLAPLQGTLKGRLLDEGALQPVTASLAASVRTSAPTAHFRHRLTAPGDGQTDYGAIGSVGRTGQLGDGGWYTASASAAYWYRTALSADGGDRVPADQVEWSLRTLLAPGRALGLGPVVTGFHRLGGIDLGDLDPADDNGFPALDAAQVKVGGELLLAGASRVSLSVTALSTVWAENNPVDTRVLSFGVGWYADGAGG